MVNAGAFALITRLAQAPEHTCVCSFEAPTADEKLLSVLQSQLDRCGPDRLTQPVCPSCDCSCVYPPDTGYTFPPVIAISILCFLLGLFASVIGSRLFRRQRVALPGPQEITTEAAQPAPAPRGPGPQSPASLRALRG